jgi:hypothetical protein
MGICLCSEVCIPHFVCCRMAQQLKALQAPGFVSFSGERVLWIRLKVVAPHFKMNCLIILLMVGTDNLAWYEKIWNLNMVFLISGAGLSLLNFHFYNTESVIQVLSSVWIKWGLVSQNRLWKVCLVNIPVWIISSLWMVKTRDIFVMECIGTALRKLFLKRTQFGMVFQNLFLSLHQFYEVGMSYPTTVHFYIKKEHILYSFWNKN